MTEAIETLDTPHTPRPLTVLDVIKIVLPGGTRGNGRWDGICEWPPDLFAVVASITERSGLYSQEVFTAYWSSDFVLTDEWIAEVRDLGARWADTDSPPDKARALWRKLVKDYGDAPIEDLSPGALAWKKIVFDLLVIADEACSGVGFLPESAEDGISNIQYAVYSDYLVWSKHSTDDPDRVGGEVLPHLPFSLCIHVPRGLLCVQPKATTPAVGCTLRSLTHNLALLPSVGNVRTAWIPASDTRQHNEPFNLLVVPFPFSIPGGSFSPADGRFPGEARDRVFRLDPGKWMNRDPVRWPGPVAAKDFAEFIMALIDEAKTELQPVHAVVLPETAIEFKLANEVADILAAKTGLNLFLAGVLSNEGGTSRNLAAIYRFVRNKVVQRSF